MKRVPTFDASRLDSGRLAKFADNPLKVCVAVEMDHNLPGIILLQTNVNLRPQHISQGPLELQDVIRHLRFGHC